MKIIKNLSGIVLITLVIIAVVLGYLIYQRSGLEKSSDILNQEVVSDQQIQSAPPVGQDELDVRNWPSQDASEEEKRLHDETVARLAVDAGQLDIKEGCVVEPLVLLVRLGETFSMRNQDAVDHSIVIDDQHVYPIPAGGEINIEADFGKGPGNYGYECTPNRGVTGVLLVAP